MIGGIRLGMIYTRAIILTIIYFFDLVDRTTILSTLIAKNFYSYCDSDSDYAIPTVCYTPCTCSPNPYPFNSNGEPNSRVNDFPYKGEPKSIVWSCPYNGEPSNRVWNYPSNGIVGFFSTWDKPHAQKISIPLHHPYAYPNRIYYDWEEAQKIHPQPINWDVFSQSVPHIKLDWFYNFKERSESYNAFSSQKKKL